MDKKFWDLVESSDSIAVTSHIAPDPDAVCSLLLLGQTLKTNFAAKTILLLLEEKPETGMESLMGYNDIKFGPLSKNIKDIKSELLCIVDTNKISRISRKEWQPIKDVITTSKTKIAIIDHHQPQDKDESDVYINGYAPAAVQEIYSLCFERNKLKKPDGYADITLFGLISDTGRFKYTNPNHRETFRIVSDLIDNGASIEKLERNFQHFTMQQLNILAHLLNNTTLGKGFTYSFIEDGFAGKWVADGKSISDYAIAVKIYVDQFIRNIEQNNWGFIVYPDLIGGKGNYAVSFRSTSDAKDVSKLAYKLNGGGHKSAAGVKIEAKSVNEVIARIKSAIDR